MAKVVLKEPDTVTEKRPIGVKFTLTDNELRALTIAKIPVVGGKGKSKFKENPQKPPMPYRFLDGTDGAPTGFGIYVGKTGCSFEVARRHGGRFVRFAIGKVDDLSVEEAHDRARKQLARLKETGDNPNRKDTDDARRDGVKRITLAECFRIYMDGLEARKKNRVKASSMKSIEESLARLSRSEVDIAKLVVRDLQDHQIMAAFDAVRLSALRRSNRIPTHLREKLSGVVDWQKLTERQLADLGIQGKYVARVQAAGVAAAEHTFAHAVRAVAFVIQLEARQAQRDKRDPDLHWNPLSILYDDHQFRGVKELDKHYRDAEVRNPLGQEDKSLPIVLKTILARREEQGGHNRTGADYLLLTLLFGARRAECARLKWFDKCSGEELRGRTASWAWLGEQGETNPFTKRKGPQVYFHDTKSGEEHFIPVCHFAERILKQRFDERQMKEAALPTELRRAEKELSAARKSTKDSRTLSRVERALELAKIRGNHLSWVFPARSLKAKEGHYSDSKSIVNNVRRDAGLLNLSQEIDIGLTPHDFRRTLGRYAAKLCSGKIVSQLLHHKVKDGMAQVSERYTDQEWAELRENLGRIEEAIIASSPRVWNRLKGTDKPRLDEANDPPAEIFLSKKQALTDA